MRKIKSTLILFFLLVVIFILSGCMKNPTVPQDPYEKFNRTVFKFDQTVDHLIYRPVAAVYKTITPPPLQRGIYNFFNNLSLLTTVPNDLLQGKFHWMRIDSWRFIINTTVGIGGLFDIATQIGLPKHYEDFGMTLAFYSDYKQPTYLILPFLGLTTFRVALTQPIDYYMTPWPYLHIKSLRYSIMGLKWTNIRASLMDTNPFVDTSFDSYTFVRSAYLQQRNKLITENEHDYTLPRKRDESFL